MKQMLWFLSIWLLAAHVQAELLAPAGYTQSHLQLKESGKAQVCPAVAVYSGELDLPSKYVQAEKSKDVIDEENDARYKALSAPISDIQQLSAAMTDRLFKGKGTAEDITCLHRHWLAWAEADALLQPAKTASGKAVRKWTLAAVSANYLKIKLNPPTEYTSLFPKADQLAIENWLAKMAIEVMHDYSNRRPEQINNHDYWAAWGVMATAVVLNRQDMFDWAGNVYQTAMMQITAEGILPNELKRRSKALSYHNFALQPLVLLAAFGEANQQPWLKTKNSALRRLADLVISNVDDSRSLEQAAGARQADERLREHSRLSWLAPYIAISGDKRWMPLLKSLPSLKTSRLGGDLQYLYLRNEPGLADKQARVVAGTMTIPNNKEQ